MQLFPSLLPFDITSAANDTKITKPKCQPFPPLVFLLSPALWGHSSVQDACLAPVTYQTWALICTNLLFALLLLSKMLQTHLTTYFQGFFILFTSQLHHSSAGLAIFCIRSKSTSCVEVCRCIRLLLCLEIWIEIKI